MTLAILAVLPAALLLDSVFGEPPARLHPVCGMGALAARIEALIPPQGSAKGFFRGLLACLLVVLPSTLLAGGLTSLALQLGGERAGWFFAVVCVYVCLAPRSLAEHALRVAEPLTRGDLAAARKAVSMMVGRNPSSLDGHGVARACVESVGENLTDGVLSTLFWAAVGLIAAGYPGAAALAVLHRSANVLDALWGKKNERYRSFGTCAARLDDVLNLFPARLSLPCIALASRVLPGLSPAAAFRIGWRDRKAHESPNSAWSEAAFAGALGLRLGGPAQYEDRLVPHPWLGDGTPDATPRHIALAVRLMRHSTIVFTLFAVFGVALSGSLFR